MDKHGRKMREHVALPWGQRPGGSQGRFLYPLLSPYASLNPRVLDSGSQQPSACKAWPWQGQRSPLSFQISG